MLETVSDIFKEAYIRGWITARDGNASIRYKEQQFFYITPSGVRKQTLQPELFKKIGFYYDKVFPIPKELFYTKISHNLKPSGELPMHFGLQTNINTEVRVILHLHPTYTIAAMYKKLNLPNLVNEFPELSRYTSIGSTVPLIPPITQELADACIKNIGYDLANGSIKYNIIGMANHGVVAVDTSPWRAFEHIERLEHICKIVLASKL
jgi:L-fuculose-phosphate aldolase